ncbi:NADH-quinone oxidoreductase subunit G [Propionimicrobium sp. BV2F7]|uniref:NADH-quinone oxidoreductase subunit G n=1 Tax=Propionimicrobium sp. BV2F7 TaxID=1111131 RepID=UPI0003D79685|nr:NADH-quinone oxidoreductase subunit G [Propionimicrobium sp. BV2F7]ETJ97015.1 NADH dehydrogenase (quinone), G subunit [Propionimicrobium sp. BV2F7]
MSTDVKPEVKPETVTFTIDGKPIEVPKGTLVIRAAEANGIHIPRFCDHPLLDPVACCRACMVEVPDAGNGRAMKPQPACALTAMPNMVIETAEGSEKVAKHQAGMLEFLLINHPLDCPICDKGGECPLQNQAMSHGPAGSRYEGAKRTYPKPVQISPLILIDRERCVLCQRCTRFGAQISGDEFLSLAERGALSQISSYETDPYESYFSGNIVQICPVGALTSTDYRFQARPFDLVSTTTTCEHCAGGCEMRTDHRHYQVKRRLAGNNPEINEEWLADRCRFAFHYGHQADRLTTPLVREGGKLVATSWPDAIDRAVAGLKSAGEAVGVLTGGRLTLENAYAYSRFARAALGTNNIDFRSRPYGPAEESFLASKVAGRKLAESVQYADLENAKKVVLVCYEPEEDTGPVFLRLRKAARKKGLQVVAIAPMLSRGNKKLSAQLVATAPGDETAALAGLELDADTIVLAGERAGEVHGLMAELAKVEERGARLAWIPRRAGELGAIEAGCLPSLLPGGRLVDDAQARVDLQAAWGVNLPAEPGLDAKQMVEQAASGELKALVTAGLEAADMPDPLLAKVAFKQAFVVSFEQRASDVTDSADVVFPVALVEDQSGTFVSWEHRFNPVNQVIDKRVTPMTDVRSLAALADAMGSDLGFRSPAQARASFDEIADWTSTEPRAVAADSIENRGSGPLKLAVWHYMIDDSRAVDGAIGLIESAPKAVVKMSVATANKYGVKAADQVVVSNEHGSYRAPAVIVDGMVDDVVWLPANTGVRVSEALQAGAGDRVQLSLAGGAA